MGTELDSLRDRMVRVESQIEIEDLKNRIVELEKQRGVVEAYFRIGKWLAVIAAAVLITLLGVQSLYLVPQAIQASVEESIVGKTVDNIEEMETRATKALSGIVGVAISEGSRELKVLDTQNNIVNSKSGRYFSFDASDLDRILGSSNWNKTHAIIRNKENGLTGIAVLWRSKPKGGSSQATAHGRFLVMGEDEWSMGQTIQVGFTSYEYFALMNTSVDDQEVEEDE
jgi:hypothetical protein